MDHTHFLRLESNAGYGRMEPRASSLEQEGLEYWEQERKRAKSTEQTFLEDQRTLLRNYDQLFVVSST